MKRMLMILLLAALLPALCACHENPPPEQLHAKLLAHFERFGLKGEVQPAAPDQEVPIYKAEAWQRLLLNGEEALLYFDDSNRADYLSDFVDQEKFGGVWRFGLRFVLVYDGDDTQVLEALNAIENE